MMKLSEFNNLTPKNQISFSSLTACSKEVRIRVVEDWGLLVGRWGIGFLPRLGYESCRDGVMQVELEGMGFCKQKGWSNM